MSLHKCRKSPSRVHFAPVIIASDAPAAASSISLSHSHFIFWEERIWYWWSTMKCRLYRRRAQPVFLSPERELKYWSCAHETKNVYNLGAENKKICHWLQRERWFHPSKVLRWESTCVYSKSRIQGPWPLRARTKSPNVMSSQRSHSHSDYAR